MHSPIPHSIAVGRSHHVLFQIPWLKWRTGRLLIVVLVGKFYDLQVEIPNKTRKR
jgi:hypothetical protein